MHRFAAGSYVSGAKIATLIESDVNLCEIVDLGIALHSCKCVGIGCSILSIDGNGHAAVVIGVDASVSRGGWKKRTKDDGSNEADPYSNSEAGLGLIRLFSIIDPMGGSVHGGIFLLDGYLAAGPVAMLKVVGGDVRSCGVCDDRNVRT
ncbi:hypothetical protein [Glycomyces sp. YM15]|uniref:hypothetical protein n=1 Tax=Glycomyces sp. YM15 TaxID=2800446 RepID=UPI0019659192|nr:hypothetical protein [Glycomyces sp. YM15]